MLEEKLDSIFQMINSHDFVTTRIFEAFKNYYFLKLNNSNYLDPYEFSDIYSMDLEDTIKLFITFTREEIAILKLIAYVDCQDHECSSTIFLKDTSNLSEEEGELEFVTCVECESEYTKEYLKYETKLKFKILPLILEKPKKSSTTYDILVSNPNLLKLSPPTFNSDNKTSGESEPRGISLALANKLNQSPVGANLSNELADLCRTFSNVI